MVAVTLLRSVRSNDELRALKTQFDVYKNTIIRDRINTFIVDNIFVAGTSGAGWSASEVGARLAGNGINMPVEVVREKLEQLKNAGFLRRDRAGFYYAERKLEEEREYYSLPVDSQI